MKKIFGYISGILNIIIFLIPITVGIIAFSGLGDWPYFIMLVVTSPILFVLLISLFVYLFIVKGVSEENKENYLINFSFIILIINVITLVISIVIASN